MSHKKTLRENEAFAGGFGGNEEAKQAQKYLTK